MRKSFLLIIVFLLVACNKEARYGPLFSVDYTIDGKAYHSEQVQAIRNNPCASPRFVRSEYGLQGYLPGGNKAHFHWEVHKPFDLVISVYSPAPYFQEGVKYHPETFSGSGNCRFYCYYPEIDLMDSVTTPESCFEFYKLSDENVYFKVLFELSVRYWDTNKEQYDTLHIKDGVFTIHDRLMLFDESRVLIGPEWQ